MSGRGVMKEREGMLKGGVVSSGRDTPERMTKRGPAECGTKASPWEKNDVRGRRRTATAA